MVKDQKKFIKQKLENLKTRLDEIIEDESIIDNFVKQENYCLLNIEKYCGPTRRSGKGMCNCCRTYNKNFAIKMKELSECPHAGTLKKLRVKDGYVYSYNCEWKVNNE